MFDLLNKRLKVSMLEDQAGNVQVGGLTEITISNANDLQTWFEIGEMARSIGITAANPQSSRSHAIFHFLLRTSDVNPALTASSNIQSQLSPSLNDDEDMTLFSKLTFIDLAGSERSSEARAPDRKTRIEGAEINKSLLALKECIRALRFKSTRKVHVPFRASKLTQVLRDSFTSSRKSFTSKCVMLTTVQSQSSFVEHSLNSLRYADRVKELNTAIAPPTPISTSRSKLSQLGSSSNVQNTSISGLRRASRDSLSSSDAIEQMDTGEVDEAFTSMAEDAADSASLYVHHTAVQSLLNHEEDLLKAHSTCLDGLSALTVDEQALLSAATTFTCDIDHYANGLERVLEEKLSLIMSLHRKLMNFKVSANSTCAHWIT